MAGAAGTPVQSGPAGVSDRELENDQSRLASREAGCPLLREDRRAMRLVLSVIAAQLIKDSESRGAPASATSPAGRRPEPSSRSTTSCADGCDCADGAAPGWSG